MKSAIACLLPLACCAFAASADASTPLDLHHPANANAHISITEVAGSVTVTAWDRNEIQVSGQLGDGTQPLAITGSNGDLVVKVQPQGSPGWFNWHSDSRMGPTTLQLRVPKGASLDIQVVSASVAVDGLDGGALAIDAVSGRTRAAMHATTAKIHSVSGNVELDGHADNADLQTVSGDILAPRLGQTVRLQTISGRVEAHGGPWKKLTLSTVSGDAQLDGALATGGTIGVDSMSGTVRLALPTATSGVLHASSFSGDLHSDFGHVLQADHGPGSTLDARLGDGQGKITLETFSGDLHIRKQD